MRPHSWTCLPWPGAAPPLVVVAVGGAEVGKGSVAPGTQVAGVLQQHCTALGLGCRGEVTDIDHNLHCNQYQTYKYFFFFFFFFNFLLLVWNPEVYVRLLELAAAVCRQYEAGQT